MVAYPSDAAMRLIALKVGKSTVINGNPSAFIRTAKRRLGADARFSCRGVGSQTVVTRTA